MRTRLLLVIAALPLLGGCGGPPGGPAPAPSPAAATPPGATLPAAAPAGLDAEILLSPEIAAAWRAVRVRVVDGESGEERLFEVPVGGADLLGASGLVLSVEAFVPDWVMDERGITSRSAEPHNPAARVVISEDGVAEFSGWLFAAMPESFVFEHPRFRVLLVEGVPVS